MTKQEKIDHPPLDKWRADAVLEPSRALWGMRAIAACLGVSADTARRWAADPVNNMPVSKPMGRWFAERGALLAWRRSR
ncbi:MAG: DNA-binding protein [Paracoccus sp. (in: a-proteobacteria)]